MNNLNATRQELINYSLFCDGDWNLINSCIKKSNQVKNKSQQPLSNDIEVITILDSNYPPFLKHLPQAPYVIYCLGNTKLLDHPFKLSIIGKRNNSFAARKILQKLIYQSREYNPLIVSGFADGIDTLSHNFALENNLSTICVLGSGFNQIYPAFNQVLFDNWKINSKVLFISEYPPHVSSQKQTFLARNRIIAALALKLLVIESHIPSGCMNTVAHGLEINRDIYAVPETPLVKNSFCNKLISNGATLCESFQDIMN